MIKIIGIKYKNKIFISEYDPDHQWSKYRNLLKYYINGSIPEKSFHSDWNIIYNDIETFQEEMPGKAINHRYEIKDKSFISEKTPGILQRDECTYYDEEDYIRYWKTEYKDYESLYELKYDVEPKKIIDVEYEYKQIMEIDNLIEYNINDYGVNETENQLIDKIVFPNILLPSKPTCLSSKESYKIIREYIKNNINPVYAEITSDYDFCFTVKKKLLKTEPEKYYIDVNNSRFNRKKRKPKYEKRYRTHTMIEIFNMAPKPYNDYTVIEGFRGKDHEDLKNNIDDYLKNLIEFINEPIKECPNCKGEGVILDKTFKADK